MSAQSLHICLANGLLRAIASAHKRQIAAHSIQQAGQSFLLAFPLMCAKQLPHSVAQSLQAAMQSLALWFKWLLVGWLLWLIKKCNQRLQEGKFFCVCLDRSGIVLFLKTFSVRWCTEH